MTLYKDRYRIESTRLKGWDYTSEGWYFVTICTHNKECLLGNMVSGQMRLSLIGEAAGRFWKDIPNHFKQTGLDEFIAMPNHVHGIICINIGTNVETCHGMSQPHGMSLRNRLQSTPNQFAKPRSRSLSTIINHYKSAVTRWCRENNHVYTVWQARFYDHIIRDESSLNKIRTYIVENPLKWETDREQVANLWI